MYLRQRGPRNVSTRRFGRFPRHLGGILSEDDVAVEIDLRSVFEGADDHIPADDARRIRREHLPGLADAQEAAVPAAVDPVALLVPAVDPPCRRRRDPAGDRVRREGFLRCGRCGRSRGGHRRTWPAESRSAARAAACAPVYPVAHGSPRSGVPSARGGWPSVRTARCPSPETPPFPGSSPQAHAQGEHEST